MSTKTRQRRATLPLTERDVEDLMTLRGSANRREALARLVTTSVSPDSSEAALLHALVVAGLRAVEEQVEEAGYAALAADQAEQAEARAIARRPRAVKALVESE